MGATARESESMNCNNNTTFDHEPDSLPTSNNDGEEASARQTIDGNEFSNIIASTTNETSGFNTTTISNATNQQESSNQKLNDDSSTYSTAFTISFDDNSNASKKLGIKDSIRKYAPPKPLTIEKPRPPKSSDQGQDYSLMSIESAPGGLSKLSPYKSRGYPHSSRSSSRRSNSSRHSNLSESAAFLIDKMLDNNTNTNKQVGTVEQSSSNYHHEVAAASFRAVRSPSSLGDSRRLLKEQQREYKHQHHHRHHHHQHPQKQKQPSSTQMTHTRADKTDNNDLDHCEDKSDNGTYIVGTDPESEAARRKIDELFGVVKAAEASVIAETALRNLKNFTDVKASTPRQSRQTDKKPLNKERLEHINRLAYRKSPMSRSSSSSRQDNISSTTTEHNSHHELRASSRHSSRTSSRDRTPRAQRVTRPRRSVSQSSRQSTNRELSDGDTRSSRSSLHNDNNEASQDCSSISSHPNMKFNRAFALRRARLGLGEPSRVSNQGYSQDSVEQSLASAASSNVINSSQRRHQINTNTYKAGQSLSAGSANFSRDDGGRFSLRMKSNALSGRLVSSAMASNRSPQHSTGIVDSYLNRVPSNKSSGSSIPNHVNTSHQNYHHQQQQQNQQESQSSRTLTKLTSQQSFTSTGMPYQSGDELDTTMSPSRYWLLQKAARNQQMQQQQQQLKKTPNDFESDTDSHGTRFNNTFAPEYEANNFTSLCESRAGSSVAGRHVSASQLGALDSLVISAISSLSLKIRHSICDVLVEHAKKLPTENETRLIVEEILPQLITSNSSRSKSPTSIEEIDQSLYFDLSHTLKNLKKIEQMVDVINLISDQLPPYSPSSPSSSQTNINSFNKSNSKSSASSLVKATSDNSTQRAGTTATITTTNSERQTSLNDLSSV